MRVLINCDDFGMHPSVNRAVVKLLQTCVKSASLMATGNAFDDAVQRLRTLRKSRVGVHLTLSSEYPNLPLYPVLPPSQIPSLLEHGRFPPDFSRWAPHTKLEEVERELEAQIQKVRGAGLEVSHLDGHMFFYLPHEGGEAIHKLVLHLAHRHHLPIRGGPRENLAFPTTFAWEECPDRESRFRFYDRFFEELATPRELLLHPADDLAALTSFTKAGERRVSDFEYFSSPRFQHIVSQRGIEIVGWESLPAAH